MGKRVSARDIFGAVLGLTLLAASPVGAACRDDVVELRGDFGQARFRVDIADDPMERARGLMFVESMPAMHGMLFVYERPQDVSFWMQNTLIPLDMIFLDESGVVQNVHENAVPLDTTSIFGGGKVLAVLEINGGLAGQIGIRPGAELRHPGLPQEMAAWACAE